MSDPGDLDGRTPLESVRVGDVNVKAGDAVRLWPVGRADIFDMALEGKTAVIESIERDLEDRIFVAVVVDDDPGREFGLQKQPGHRFFFGVEEIEPLPGESAGGIGP
jgi:hypothetical protein